MSGDPAGIKNGVPHVEMATVNVVNDVLFEQIRARAKHGVQELPDGISPDRYTNELEEIAKHQTDSRARRGVLTWADVAREEWHELLNAKGAADRRMEAIQLAQVLVSWVEDMDKRDAAPGAAN